MTPDLGTPSAWILWLGGGLFVVPLAVPIASAAIVSLVSPSVGMVRAMRWGIPLGILNVPFSWAAFRFGVTTWNPFWEHGWGAWAVAMVASAGLTVLILWWRARRSRRST